MSILGSETIRTLRELERLTGRKTFTWHGNDYQCVGNTAESMKDLGVGGWEIELDLSIFVRRQLLPSPGPKEIQSLSFDGKVYRIANVKNLPGDAVQKLICEFDSKGA